MHNEAHKARQTENNAPVLFCIQPLQGNVDALQKLLEELKLQQEDYHYN